jgi:hypothetical protein
MTIRHMCSLAVLGVAIMTATVNAQPGSSVRTTTPAGVHAMPAPVKHAPRCPASRPGRRQPALGIRCGA